MTPIAFILSFAVFIAALTKRMRKEIVTMPRTKDKPMYKCPKCGWVGADYHRPVGELPRCPDRACRAIVIPLMLPAEIVHRIDEIVRGAGW